MSSAKSQLRFCGWFTAAAALSVSAAVAAPVSAQVTHSHHAGGALAPVASTTTRAVAVPVLDQAPSIDGRIEAGEWARAAQLDGFTQLEPREGVRASDSTRVFVGRDAENLYVAFVAYDADVAHVRAARTPRDKIDAAGDYVGILLDPTQSRTRAYFLAFNPLGVQYDGIWSQQWDFGWDGVMSSSGTIGADRYVVEVAIPFATVGGGSGAHPDWDVNFMRFVARSGEEAWWAPRTRAHRNTALSESGQLTAMPVHARTSRVEMIPTVTSQRSALAGQPSVLDSRWGATVRIPVSTSGRIEGTYRPDFSHVETDEAQIGFNERYALFYPEKRPFFLESADRFATPAVSYDSDPLTLVHTRTIVRPRVGGRALFMPSNGFVGAMVVAEDRPDGSASGTSAIGRAVRTWGNGSQIGVVGTRREYRAGGMNAVAGADATIHLPASTAITAQFARSESHDTIGASTAAVAGYLDVARDDGRGFQQVVYRRIPQSFAADLGFVPRTDVQQVVSHVGRYWRPNTREVLYLLPMLQYTSSWTVAGHDVDAEWLPHVEAQLTHKSSAWLGYRARTEEFRAKRYDAARLEAKLKTSPYAWVDLAAGAKVGRGLRYDNTADAEDLTYVAPTREANASAEFRVRQTGSIAGNIIWRRLEGNGRTDARAVAARTLWLGRVRAAWQFDNATYIRAIAQYDPDLDRRTASLLLGRELNYGTQLHLGVERGSGGADINPMQPQSVIFIRLSYLLRP